MIILVRFGFGFGFTMSSFYPHLHHLHDLCINYRFVFQIREKCIARDTIFFYICICKTLPIYMLLYIKKMMKLASTSFQVN